MAARSPAACRPVPGSPAGPGSRRPVAPLPVPRAWAGTLPQSPGERPVCHRPFRQVGGTSTPPGISMERTRHGGCRVGRRRVTIQRLPGWLYPWAWRRDAHHGTETQGEPQCGRGRAVWGRRPLCTLPRAAQCPGRQQRGPRAGHRGVGSGRGGKEGLRTQLRLGTGRVLAQVCPASRGSRSRRRPAGRQGALSPPEMPLRTPRVQTRTCARSPNPGGARRRGRKRLLARVLLGTERGRGRRRSPALAKARATAVQPRNLGHTRVPLTAAMSPSPAVTRAAGALAQREWGQEGDYRPPPFMASRGSTHLCGHCGGQDAFPLPGPGRRFTPPAHPVTGQKTGVRAVALFVYLSPFGPKDTSSLGKRLSVM